ncbi:hypothetical protein LguiB_016879 [Lonicera macranthoides]
MLFCINLYVGSGFVSTRVRSQGRAGWPKDMERDRAIQKEGNIKAKMVLPVRNLRHRYTSLPLSATPINDHHTSQPIHGSSTATDDHCRLPSATPLIQHQSLHKTVYQCPEIPWEPNNVDPSSQHHTTELSHRSVATMDIDLRDLLELGYIDLSVLYLQSAHRSEDIWAREEWHTTILLRTRRYGLGRYFSMLDRSASLIL